VGLCLVPLALWILLNGLDDLVFGSCLRPVRLLWELRRFRKPDSEPGPKTVLDIGAWTGWCSFALERRGADVTAIDCVEFEEFRVARKLLGLRIIESWLSMSSHPTPSVCTITCCV